jgi:L-lactate dehydrogenase
MRGDVCIVSGDRKVVQVEVERKLLMHVGVVGTGNVGSALIYQLANNPGIEKIHVMSRSAEKALGCIMDVASAFPGAAVRMTHGCFENMANSDIVVLTAGVQMKPGQTAKHVLKPNLDLTKAILQASPLKKSAIVICLATPVDDITIHVQNMCKLPREQVFGFGGDLDKNRLEYILSRAGKKFDTAKIVGEHGRNAIPVYAEDTDYAQVASQVRTFLSTITSYTGETRNLASGALLGQLVDTIVNDLGRTHYVCAYHPGLRTYLTWPFVIGRNGVKKPEEVKLSGSAAQDFELLLSTRTALAQRVAEFNGAASN